MNTQPLSPPDVTPVLYPAEFIDGPRGGWVICGACGCNRAVEAYVFVNGPQGFDAVCDCPLPAAFPA